MSEKIKCDLCGYIGTKLFQFMGQFIKGKLKTICVKCNGADNELLKELEYPLANR